MAQEFVVHSAEGTVATMVDDAHIDNVPVMIGGQGRNEVMRFYSTQFLPGLPSDFSVSSTSRTVGADQLVDELIMSFTHSVEMPWMLPGLAPTHRRVELPIVVIVGFRGDKISHEHIYWDQGSLLKQIGLLSDPNIPVYGSETASRLVELSKTGPSAEGS